VQKKLLLRMLLCLVIGIVLAAVGSELAFHFQGQNTSRAAGTIELVIPAGTAQKVAEGESIIPASQTFVVGDTLVVNNQDSVTHNLGPLIVPAGASASMKLDQAGNLDYVCSFQPSRYYGIDIQPALTINTRLEASLIAGIPLGLLLGVYSLVLYPIKPKEKPSQP
jgi:plastocyanin